MARPYVTVVWMMTQPSRRAITSPLRGWFHTTVT